MGAAGLGLDRAERRPDRPGPGIHGAPPGADEEERGQEKERPEGGVPRTLAGLTVHRNILSGGFSIAETASPRERAWSLFQAPVESGASGSEPARIRREAAPPLQGAPAAAEGRP